MSLVIADNDAGARMSAAIRDDSCRGELAAAGADAEVGALITVLGQIREGSQAPRNRHALCSYPMKQMVF
jgi:hypothetical protein